MRREHFADKQVKTFAATRDTREHSLRKFSHLHSGLGYSVPCIYQFHHPGAKKLNNLQRFDFQLSSASRVHVVENTSSHLPLFRRFHRNTCLLNGFFGLNASEYVLPYAGSIQAKLADCYQRQKLRYVPLFTVKCRRNLWACAVLPILAASSRSCTAVHALLSFRFDQAIVVKESTYGSLAEQRPGPRIY